MRSRKTLEQIRRAYPASCYWCGETLDGPPPTDEELHEMLDEHDRLFPGEPLETSTVICDPCFLAHCPGGRKISMN